MGERGRQYRVSGVDDGGGGGGGGLAVFSGIVSVRLSSCNLQLSRHNLIVLQLSRLSSPVLPLQF